MPKPDESPSKPRGRTITIPDEYFKGLAENDDWAIFKALKRWTAAKRLTRLEEWEALGKAEVLLKSSDIFDVRHHTEYHYSFSATGFKYRLSYYPSTGRWVSDGKTFNGGVEAMFGWLRNRREEIDREFASTPPAASRKT